MNISITIGEAAGFSIGIIVGGGLILSYIFYPEKYQRIAYHIFWFLSLIPVARKYLVYKKIGSRIESNINISGKKINSQAPGVLPHAMKIEWAKTGDAVSAFLSNGDVVIRMGRDDDNDRATAISTLAYIEKDLLFDARHYIDPTLMQATDYNTAKELLSDMKHNRAISYLMTHCIEPAIQSNHQLGDDCIALDKISLAGYFSRLFLPQLNYLTKKIWPNTTSGAIQRETRGFMEFILSLSEKRGGDEFLPSFEYLQPRIKVRVLLAARKETKSYGMKPYIRRIKEAQSKGIEYLYICGWGIENVEFIKSLAKDQEIQRSLSILNSNEYKRLFEGIEVKAISIIAALNLNISAEDISKSSDIVRIILEENVEELRKGQIEIKAVAREPGIISVVAVKSLVAGLNAFECIMKQGTSGKLDELFNEEKLIILPWCDEPSDMIATALFNGKLRKDIKSIELDTNNKRAIVRIANEDSRKIAVGKKGLHVRLASELTGWRIDIRKELD